MKVTPRSMALRTMRSAISLPTDGSARCHPPRPMAETRSPVRPSVRYGMEMGCALSGMGMLLGMVGLPLASPPVRDPVQSKCNNGEMARPCAMDGFRRRRVDWDDAPIRPPSAPPPGRARRRPLPPRAGRCRSLAAGDDLPRADDRRRALPRLRAAAGRRGHAPPPRARRAGPPVAHDRAAGCVAPRAGRAAALRDERGDL